MCEQCREQDQNPNGVFLHAKTEHHGNLAGRLAVIWDYLTDDDLERLEKAVYRTDGYYNQYVDKIEKSKTFKVISDWYKEINNNG